MNTEKKLIDCFEPVEVSDREILNTPNSNFTGITQDSRKVLQGGIFVCIPGEKVDGHDFIKQAVENGAKLIISQKKLPENINCPYIVVKDTKFAMACLSAIFYKNPSRDIDLIGVTGTNGKTTVTHLVETIFKQAKIPCALMGTLGSRFSPEESYAQTEHTTEQAPELQQKLRDIADKGIKKAVMEVSSHALDQHRVTECEFSGAAFTNLTQDHLDYHITMDNYFKAKSKLLNLLKSDPDKNKYAIINADDRYLSKLTGLIPKNIENVKVFTYGVTNKANITAEKIEFCPEGSKFICKTPVGNKKVKIRLAGMFNVYNVLTAIGIAIAEGIELNTIIKAVESTESIPGRFETVSTKPLVVIDYAHTPNGLENVLEAAKAIVPAKGQLICVFGCGGDRDVTKRPQMGRIAENLCDKIIITSDNPRTEDPQQIITDILTGISKLNTTKIIVEPDRAIAIEQAIVNSRKDDVIVIAGKGHEDYQLVNNEKLHFDDREEAKKALRKIKK